MPELRRLKPEEVILSLFDLGPGKDWDLEKILPSGERVIVPYRLQVLRVAENFAAIKNAQDTAKEQGELKEYGDIYREAQAHEILQRAIRQREKRTREDGTEYYPFVFVDTNQLRASLNEMEMAALLNAYEITKSEFSVVKGLNDSDAESWIARLSDPLRGPFHLSQLDSLHWPALCLLLAKVCKSLYEESGHELPTWPPTSESAPETSTNSTGSSQTPPTASSTESDVKVPGDRLISKAEADEILRKRKAGTSEDSE